MGFENTSKARPLALSPYQMSAKRRRKTAAKPVDTTPCTHPQMFGRICGKCGAVVKVIKAAVRPRRTRLWHTHHNRQHGTFLPS